jgi:uncharacterized protein (DUF427 family)
MRPQALPIKPGQESVWDYPRPPRLERIEKPVQIIFADMLIVDAPWCHRVLETSHPPVYYIEREHIAAGTLEPAAGSSFCEWKGMAAYFDLLASGRRAERAAWCYPDPTPAFVAITDAVAFYAQAMDRCTVGGEVVTPQPGGFYGGWITSDIVGPFKGEPGSLGW